MIRKLSLLAFSAIAMFGYSQNTAVEEKNSDFESKLTTVDRGAYTRPAQNIRKGLQLEYGLNYEWTDSDNNLYKTDVFSPAQLKLRWGLSDRVEFNFKISNNQMVVRPWDETTMSVDKYNYWSPLDIGVRAQFADSKKKMRF
ncbi:MAG: hypothetical protein LRY27_03050 [Chitinophagales bacterium]|nr:hypothetical protein [Chitinophagales bacterium]